MTLTPSDLLLIMALTLVSQFLHVAIVRWNDRRTCQSCDLCDSPAIGESAVVDKNGTHRIMLCGVCMIESMELHHDDDVT